ncbi:hypothetical protein L3X38_030999 [Prunus dulcis]|uniref:GRAS family transcription factor n=1 Tax=Prunus dulcis TaxID=3755 RepID=A0AAD4VCT0_PRUDU|nr:hypothetical protein L3X38_030999 [Prunus dulcis]
MEELNFGHGSNSVSSDQNLINGLQVNHEPTNKLLLPANLDRPNDSSTSSEGDTVDGTDCNLPVLKYISDILLEEDLEGKPCMLEDILGLQAAEKSFYDALNQMDPHLPNHPSFSVYQNFENSDGGFRSSNGSISGFQSSNGSIAAKTGSVWDFSETSHVQTSPVESLSDITLVSDSFSDMQSLGNSRGVGKGNEIIDLEGYQCKPPSPDTLYRNLASVPENYGYNSTNGSKGKKNRQREDGHYTEEGRSNKQSAAFADDSDPQEMFDKVLQGVNPESESCFHDESLNAEGTRKLQHNKQSKGSKTTCSKKPNSNRQVVDLCKLLTECAQAVGSYDQQSASELLKQIRQHSSPYGYATQRLAHYFAEGLEARLAGARSLSYPPLLFMHTSTTEFLKAYQVYVSACPFKKMFHFFANRTIMKQTEKATRLHIIDFGISYGLQWPCLIQSLSEKTGGPPNLRITAIELPQPGFRPAERIEETGRRLAKYSKRYSVPFEYNVIAKKWETIRLEELQIDRNEVIVVNCMHRLKQIPDETVMMNNPRDAVLNLIKRINPDLFMHGVVNGTYNAPAFVTRFKQLLFHFHALFDMYEATVPRDNEHRLLFERAIFGTDIVNVIACEGVERVERPETYKQWQARYVRAGFKQLPLDRELLKKMKTMLKMMGYHKDFGIEDDGEWMLQGWKGRIIIALSALKPA